MLSKKSIKQFVYEELPAENYTQNYYLNLHQRAEAYFVFVYNVQYLRCCSNFKSSNTLVLIR